METSLLFGQALSVWLIALWLALGALENIRNPAVNRDMVRGVMGMDRMRETYPEIFAVFGRNRTENRRAQDAAFRAIVVVECVVTLILLAGAAALTLALFGLAAPGSARAVAAFGAAAFSGIWGGFLVGGQWYHYWCGYEGSQVTHFLAALWGLATFIALHL
mgnify:CR=1 FL=1